MGFLKFKKKDLKKEQENLPVDPNNVNIPIDDDIIYENGYYNGVSRIFHLFEYIFIVAALLFAITCVASDPEIISYDNFLMFTENVNTSMLERGSYTELVYDTDLAKSISLYRGGVFVPGNDSVFVFSATGRRSYTHVHGFKQPRLETSDSVAILYDFASNRYTVYNSYTKLYDGENGAPIYACAVSDSGAYALVEKQLNGKYGVSVYSKNNVNVCSFISERYVVSVGLDSAGDRLAVLSLGVLDGERYFDLKVYDCNNGEILLNEKKNGEYPKKCLFSNNGELCVVSDKQIYFYSPEHKRLGTALADDVSVIETDKNGLLVATGKNVYVYAYNGTLLYSGTFNTSVVSSAVSEDSVYVLLGSSVHRINVESGKIESKDIEDRYVKVLASSGRHIVLCGVSGASLVEFD